jgi:hypothetical protein
VGRDEERAVSNLRVRANGSRTGTGSSLPQRLKPPSIFPASGRDWSRVLPELCGKSAVPVPYNSEQ